MIPLEECLRRDAILRAFIEAKDWDLDAEQRLRRSLVLQSRELLSAYPFLVGVEWPAYNRRPGDLLFYDGAGGFAAVEVKSLASGDRTERRGKVERQAREAAAAAGTLYPGAEVKALVYTDDEVARGAGPRHPDERW